MRATPDFASILERMFEAESSPWVVITAIADTCAGMFEFVCKQADLDPAEFLETYALYLQHPNTESPS